jgi:hypothetical protein
MGIEGIHVFVSGGEDGAYLGCWCNGTLCEESDTETEPFILLGASASSSNATLRAGCVAPLLGWTN